MANPLLKARLKGHKRVVSVYKHSSGDYVDYADCETTYTADELVFPDGGRLDR